MRKYGVILYRYFYIADELEIEAENETEAYTRAEKDFSSLTSTLPDSVYDSLTFSESDIEVLDQD